MTGLTLTTEFNRFFIDNYDYLQGFAKSINPSHDYESLLHDSYLKCYKRIDLSGYSGTTFINFIRVTICNTYKTFYRNKKDLVAIENEDLHYDNLGDNLPGQRLNRVGSYQEEAEMKLLEEEEYRELQKERDLRVSYINACVFEYVNKYFTPKEEMIFKTYFVLRHKHLNYKQLSEAVNLSMTSVSKTIKKIKKELRVNLKCYINTGLNVMELRDLVKKVEALLPTDVRSNQQNYRETYQQVFGKPWSGCTCNLTTLKESLRQWYNKNKTI